MNKKDDIVQAPVYRFKSKIGARYGEQFVALPRRVNGLVQGKKLEHTAPTDYVAACSPCRILQATTTSYLGAPLDKIS